MSEFIELPVRRVELSHRKLVYGYGINDAEYLVKYRDEKTGRHLFCPYYIRWANMLQRCYFDDFHKKQPTYRDCVVSDQWIYFSKFKEWMKEKDWKEKHLDKDILVPFNKVYGKEFCIFIPRSLNSLFVNRKSERGDFPLGVSFSKEKGKFRSYCNVNGRHTHIGYFITPEAASLAYRQFKSSLITEAAYQHPHIKTALLKHADLMLNGEIL